MTITRRQIAVLSLKTKSKCAPFLAKEEELEEEILIAATIIGIIHKTTRGIIGLKMQDKNKPTVFAPKINL